MQTPETSPEPVSTNENEAPAPPFPDKGYRPRAYDHDEMRYQWHFGVVPKHIREGGGWVESPFRKVAVYVVHGIGQQSMSETAATLRIGIEDAVRTRDPGKWDASQDDCWIVPEPYIYDGFWADYADFEKTVPKVFAMLGEVPRRYFERVWRGRSQSAFSAYGWLVASGSRLIWRSFRELRPAAVYYVFLIPMLWVVAAVMLARGKWRAILEEFVGDVPLYVTPKGDVQNDIVQRIDRRVGGFYLRLIGLDENLDDLPRERWPRISGERHRFEEVVWVSHSLGTVISYNVIGDLLQLANNKRVAAGGEHDGADRLEKSLRSFVTLGSPLDKMKYLFDEENASERTWPALRPWPSAYLPGGARSLWNRPSFHWTNFFYAADPVSGRLDEFRDDAGERLIENHHTKGWRIPVMAHVRYWTDASVLGRILELTYGNYVTSRDTKTRSSFWIRVSAIGTPIVLLATLLGAIVAAGWYVYSEYLQKFLEAG